MTPTTPDPDPTRDAARSRGAAWALSGCLLALVVMALTMLAPSPVRPPTTDDTFSAESARADLDALAAEPRPTGSPAHARVRQHLVAELEALGLTVEESAPRFASATQEVSGGQVSTAAWTRNVVARAEGSEGRGTVVLLAHYDSVRNSPGASDNGYGVASVLETTRALTASGTARNDLVVVLSDAEEIGLLGAQAIIDSQRLDPATTVVVNQEARGNAGATQLVRASGDLQTVRAVAGGPRAQGGSEIASLFSNATEFDVFAPAGYRVLDLASSAGSAAYDSGADDLAGVDDAALQQRGDLVLQTARTLLADDLTLPWQAEQLTWFAVPGTLVVLPTEVVGWGLVVAAALVVVAAGVGLRRRRAGGQRLRTGAAAAVRTVLAAVAVALTAGLAALAVTGWWQLLVAVRPAYGSFVFADTPRPLWHQVSVLAIAALSTTGVHLLLARRLGRAAVVRGHVLLVVGLATLSTLVLPAAAHLFVLPAVVAAVLVLLRAVLDRPLLSGSWLAPYAVTVLVLLVPTADVGAAGLGQAWLPAAGVSLIVWPLLPLAATVRPRLPGLLAVALTATVLVSAVLGLGTDRIEPGHPRHSSLALVQPADAADGTWLSTADDPWATSFATGAPGPGGLPPDPVLGLQLPVRAGPGPAVDRRPPGLTPDEEQDIPAGRRITVTLDPAGADRVALHPVGRARVVAVDGQELADGPGAEQFVHLITEPDAATRYQVEVVAEDAQPVTLHALGMFGGLDGVAGYRPPPPDTTWSPEVLNALTAVESTVVL